MTPGLRVGLWIFAAATFALPCLGQLKQPPPPPPPESTYNPYLAEKDMNAGVFYLKKGKLDAAIARFQDALLYHPDYAMAYRRLGEAFEKKGDKQAAVKNYQKYLEILPHADDAKKIRKRIQKLSREIQEERPANDSSG